MNINQIENRIEELETELKSLKISLKEKMKEKLFKRIQKEHTEIIINELTNELVENAIKQSKIELVEEEEKVETTLPPLPLNLSQSPMTPKQTLSQLSSPSPTQITPEDLVDYDAEESFLRKQMKKDEEIKYEKNGKPYICKKETSKSELKNNYKKMKVPELKKLCKLRKIKKYSKLKKQQLIDLLKGNQ